MDFCILIIELIFLIFFANARHLRIVHGQLNIFQEDEICDHNCSNGGRHTLCETNPLPECNKYTIFNIFDIRSMSEGRALELLVIGHNGLRDRIARKMSVANMVKLNWDNDLANMAKKYFQMCTPYADDPCTLFTIDDLYCREIIEYKEKDDKNYRFIAQNRFALRADYLPKFFIENALRSWYYEKNKMQAPTYNNTIYQDAVVGILNEETNFTHLAFPLISNMGCSIAQVDNVFEIICNYYPYYRLSDGYMMFLNGTGASSCPSYYPLPSESYASLCGDSEEYENPDSSMKFMPTLYFMVLVVVLPNCF